MSQPAATDLEDQKSAYADFKQLRKTGINPFS